MSTQNLPPEKVIARVSAGAALTIAAGHTSEAFDRLALWFLAAFGAGLALTISHLNEVSAFIPLHTVSTAAYLFFAATVLCVAQRYVAMVVSSGAKAAKEGREMGEKLQHMDSDEFVSEMLIGIPWPARLACKQQFAAMARGDFAIVGRSLMRLAMLQGILASAQVIVLLVALEKVLNEIKA